MNEASSSNAPTPRRDFVKKVLAGIIGGILTLFPVGAGLTVLLDPLRRKSTTSGPIRVTTLDALPDDGVPHKFPVIATKVNAWNKIFQSRIGMVYLRRTSDNQIQAFNVVCPHLGCPVDFRPQHGNYLCPCHNSTFTVEGKVQDPSSPAARGLDSLEVEVRNQKEVWVKFRNFQTGLAEKIPVA
jgi:menaquinol-cytochrome c reductase iron-sulfur subunit